MLEKIERALLFLVILFLPTQLGRHFWPDFSHVFSLPVDYLSPTIYFWDLLVLGLLIVWLFSKPKIKSWTLNLLFIFLFFQASSIVFAQNIGAGLVRVEQYLTAGLFGIYLSSKEGLLKEIKLPLMLSLIFESVLAIGQFFNKGSLGFWLFGERHFEIFTPAIAKFDFYGLEFLRPYGTFSHPNVLAAFLLIGLILLSLRGTYRSGTSSGNLDNKDSHVVRQLADFLGMTSIVTIFLCSFALLLTVSRTAILAAGIASLIMLKGRLKTFTLVLILILSPILATRFLSLTDFDNLTWQRREELIESSVGMIVKSPLVGVGLNNFIPHSATQVISGPSRFLQPAHNIFLLQLAETGIIGFFGLLLLLYFPIKSCFLKKSSDLIFSRLFTIWMIIIFLGMFDHYFLTLPQGYRLLFLIWGLSLSKS